MSPYLVIAVCVFIASMLTWALCVWLAPRRRDSGSDDHSALG